MALSNVSADMFFLFWCWWTDDFYYAKFYVTYQNEDILESNVVSLMVELNNLSYLKALIFWRKLLQIDVAADDQNKWWCFNIDFEIILRENTTVVDNKINEKAYGILGWLTYNSFGDWIP